MGEDANGGCTKSTTLTAAEEEESTGVMRIYVGGLGGTVTADDLRKTFSAPHLGTVTAADVIRTKGRSFAYLEFLPSSDKGLAKLFSSYNGCMWKGGKLRLEKAKEHYLIRLKREWEENAEELASDSCSHDVDAIESVNPQDKPKKIPDMENMQLRLFFPRLGKVKPLPFKGTGKHKYSFQRVQVPPLPFHFCDCEEHSGALDVAKQQKDFNILNPAKEESLLDHEMDGGGVNEEELNMMNSVMTKLLERENVSKVVSNGKAKVSLETHNVISSNDDLGVAEDQEYQMSDDDNLVINLVSGSNNKLSALDNQELVLKELRNSKDNRAAQKMHESQKRKSVHSTEKSKRHNERNDADTGTVTDTPERKKRKVLPSKKKKAPLDEDGVNDTVSVVPEREGGSDIHINSLGTAAEFQHTNSESKISNLSGKSARSKKSAWNNLVRGTENTTFQISDIAPSISHGVEVGHVVEVQPVLDTLTESSIDKENLKNDSLPTEEPKVSAQSVTDEVEVQPGSDTHGEPPTDKENLKHDAAQTEEPKVSAHSASHDVELQLGSDTLSGPPTDKESLQNESLQTEEAKVSAEALSSKENVPAAADKTTKGALWLQKSSWTKLVGDSNSSSFSISQILPNLTFDKQELQQHTSIDFSSSMNKKRQNYTGQVFEPQRRTRTDVLASREGNHDGEQFNAETNLQEDRKNNEASTSSSGKKQPSAPRPGDTDMDESFSFMRSSASMKEWMKTKAAISGSLKKKGNLK